MFNVLIMYSLLGGGGAEGRRGGEEHESDHISGEMGS